MEEETRGGRGRGAAAAAAAAPAPAPAPAPAAPKREEDEVDEEGGKVAVGGLEKRREGGRTDGRTREVQRTLPRPAYPHRACNCNCNSCGPSRRSRESTERLPARRLYTHVHAPATHTVRACVLLSLRSDATPCSDRGNNRSEGDGRTKEWTARARRRNCYREHRHLPRVLFFTSCSPATYF